MPYIIDRPVKCLLGRQCVHRGLGELWRETDEKGKEDEQPAQMLGFAAKKSTWAPRTPALRAPLPPCPGSSPALREPGTRCPGLQGRFFVWC